MLNSRYLFRFTFVDTCCGKVVLGRQNHTEVWRDGGQNLLHIQSHCVRIFDYSRNLQVKLLVGRGWCMYIIKTELSMPIISISRGSYHRGRDVAHMVAEKLRYECISRDSLLENSEHFDIPEIKLMPNVQHAAQVLERFSFGRERYINYMSSSLLRFLKNDNHVYHGLAGQFFVTGVSHVVKVRIIANMDVRVKDEATRREISPDQARMHLKKDDEERRKWAMLLYGVDIVEPENYDMVLNISTMGVEDAADVIVRSASFPCYQASGESSRIIQDLALESEAKAALFDYPQAAVVVHDGNISVQVKVPEDQADMVRGRVESAIGALEDVGNVDIGVIPYY